MLQLGLLEKGLANSKLKVGLFNKFIIIGNLEKDNLTFVEYDFYEKKNSFVLSI